MMRSLYSGVSGLKIHQTKMDVIANNISNVNTTAYKSSRVTFSDYFSQTLSSAQSGNSSRGGINPMQIGLGANIASIDINMGQGVNQRTDRSLDCMVSGEGFFIVGQGTNTVFTRDGNFGLDGYGNLVTASGLNVMGWPATADPKNPGKYIASKGTVSAITLTPGQQTMKAQTTKNLETTGNVNVVGNPNNPSAAIEHATTFTVYDSIGNKFTIDAKYVWDTTNKQMQLAIGNKAVLNGNPDNAYELTVGADGTIDFKGVWDDTTSAYLPVVQTETMSFNTDGTLDPGTITPPATTGDPLKDGKFNLTITDSTGQLPADTYFGGSVSDGTTTTTDQVILDASGMTIFDNIGSTAIIQSLDGNPPGTLSDVSIAPDGSFMGMYTNGEQRLLAKIALAKFDNPSGLARAGGNTFQTTANSGEFNGIGVEASDIGSAISSGQLEMSNVDIAQEFVDMITTQRGFQANSKSITTSDEMLQELVNLKR